MPNVAFTLRWAVKLLAWSMFSMMAYDSQRMWVPVKWPPRYNGLYSLRAMNRASEDVWSWAGARVVERVRFSSWSNCTSTIRSLAMTDSFQIMVRSSRGSFGERVNVVGITNSVAFLLRLVGLSFRLMPGVLVVMLTSTARIEISVMVVLPVGREDEGADGPAASMVTELLCKR